MKVRGPERFRRSTNTALGDRARMASAMVRMVASLSSSIARPPTRTIREPEKSSKTRSGGEFMAGPVDCEVWDYFQPQIEPLPQVDDPSLSATIQSEGKTPEKASL